MILTVSLNPAVDKTCRLNALVPGRVNRRWALAAIIMGPLLVLVCGTVLPLPGGIDPLCAGVLASLVCCLIGLAAGRKGPESAQKT